MVPSAGSRKAKVGAKVCVIVWLAVVDKVAVGVERRVAVVVGFRDAVGVKVTVRGSVLIAVGMTVGSEISPCPQPVNKNPDSRMERIVGVQGIFIFA